LRPSSTAHPDRLKVVHTLTREPDPTVHGPGVVKGRVTSALLKDLIPDPSSCVVYACGPAVSTWDRLAAKEAGTAPTPRFMESAIDILNEVGVPKDRVKRESYG
jgi:ferredoxin-NADP reductase